MLSKVKSFIKSCIGNDNNDLERYINRRKKHLASPYSTSLYEDLIKKIRSENNYHLRAFVNPEVYTSVSNFYIRHDIDTLDCLNNASSLLDIDQDHNISSGVYFRADEEEYPLKDCVELANKYENQNIEFGLHTVCYTDDDYFGLFQREIDYFQECIGFPPKSFTVHGFNPSRRKDIRYQFHEQVHNRLNEFNMLFSDCHPSLRKYDYVIQDCHSDKHTGTRYMKDDIKYLPKPVKGRNYLFLTHPCYWS